MSLLGLKVEVDCPEEDGGSIWADGFPLMGGFCKKSPNKKFTIFYGQNRNDRYNSRIVITFGDIVQFEGVYPKTNTAAVDNFGRFAFFHQDKNFKSILYLYDLNNKLLFTTEYLVSFGLNMIFAETNLIIAHSLGSKFDESLENSLFIIDFIKKSEKIIKIDGFVKSLSYQNKRINVLFREGNTKTFSLDGEVLQS